MEIIINIKGGQIAEPKEIQILDSKLKVVVDVWITSRKYSVTLPVDTYIVRLKLATKEHYDIIVMANIQDKATVNFDLRNEEGSTKWKPVDLKTLTPEDRLLVAIFGDKALNKIRPASPSIIGITIARLWTKDNGLWTSKLLPEVTHERLITGTLTFNLKAAHKFHILELQNPNQISQFISVPASPSVKCIIK